MNNYKCTVCQKSVTPAAFQYCTKKEYPVMCHKHQQEYGLNSYNVASDLEIEISRETAAKEAIERQIREEERKSNIIPNIEHFVNKVVINKDFSYARALFNELELAKRENLITPDQYNKYIEIYYSNKDKKSLTAKQKADVWKKEIIKKVTDVVKATVKQNNPENGLTKEIVLNQLQSIINEYQHIETDAEEYLYTYLVVLQDVTESYYYEDGNEIKFGYKM